MAISSINFKGVKADSELHNNRGVELDYVRKDLIGDNQHWEGQTIESAEKECRDFCLDKSGRKMMSNAQVIKEAVINLNPEHNIDDVARMCDSLKENFSIEAFQIHIHRDEGHYDEENEWKTNHHAHILFKFQDLRTHKWVNEKGQDLHIIDGVPVFKTDITKEGKIKGDYIINDKYSKVRKFKPHQLSHVQTHVARQLGMERGKSKKNSNRERLEPIEYKRQEEQKKVKLLQEQTQVLEQKKNQARARVEELQHTDSNLREIYAKLDSYNPKAQRLERRGAEIIELVNKFGELTTKHLREYTEEEINWTTEHINRTIQQSQSSLTERERENAELERELREILGK